MVVDLAMMSLAATAGYLAWPGHNPWQAVLAIVFLWGTSLAARGAYDPRRIGVGSDEFKNIVTSTVVIFTLLASLAYAFNLTVGRQFLIATFLAGLVLLPWVGASCAPGCSPAVVRVRTCRRPWSSVTDRTATISSRGSATTVAPVSKWSAPWQDPFRRLRPRPVAGPGGVHDP